jgi:hypothetical protein
VSDSTQRWYDQDPALKRALDQLRQAPDAYHAQVALNIIKIVVEHSIEDASAATLDKAVDATQRLVLDPDEPSVSYETLAHNAARRRWYDVNETLRSAMKLLSDCPTDLQEQLIPSITRMIEQTLADAI